MGTKSHKEGPATVGGSLMSLASGKKEIYEYQRKIS